MNNSNEKTRELSFMKLGIPKSWAGRLAEDSTDGIPTDDPKNLFRDGEFAVHMWHTWYATREGHYFWACVYNSIKERGTVEFFKKYPSHDDFYEMLKNRIVSQGAENAMD